MDWADVLLEWWDRWLKNDGRADLGPRVQVEDNTGQWRNAARWPDGRAITYYLDPEHRLSTSPSKDTAAETVATDPFHTQGGYTNDVPGHNAQCPPRFCTYFETGAFKDDFRISGLPRVELTVVPQGPGGQLSAYLYAASGDAMERIGWGQFDLRFRDGSDQAEEVAPGEELKVAFDVQPLDAVVPKGARLYVVLSGGTGWNRLPSLPNYPVEILEGGKQSSITLVNTKPSKGDFFKPPSS
jgi:predicted acyl esterase